MLYRTEQLAFVQFETRHWPGYDGFLQPYDQRATADGMQAATEHQNLLQDLSTVGFSARFLSHRETHPLFDIDSEHWSMVCYRLKHFLSRAGDTGRR
jgi:hypothetical protein